MKKIKTLLLLLIFCLPLIPVCFAAAETSATVSDLEALRQALSDSAVSEIVIQGEISGAETLQLDGRSNLIVRGESAVLDGISFRIDGCSVISFQDIVFRNATDSTFTVDNTQQLTFSDCSFLNAGAYALDVSSSQTRSSVIVSNWITSGNGKGGAILSGGSYLQITGTVGTEDLVVDPALAEQIRTEEFDRNVGPNDELCIAVTYEKDQGVVNFPEGSDYFVCEVTSEGKEVCLLMRPYDAEAPSFDLLAFGSPSVSVGEAVSLDQIGVSDNRTEQDEIIVRFTGTCPDGTDLSFSGASERYPNGLQFVAEQAGEYEICCVAEDLYGNQSSPRYVYITTEQASLPVISNPKLPGLSLCGEEVRLPEYTAADAEGQSVTCTVRVTAPDGTEVTLTGNAFVPEQEGVYLVEVRAGDAVRTQSLFVTAEPGRSDPGSFPWGLLIGILAACVVVGLLTAEFLVARKGKSRKD